MEPATATLISGIAGASIGALSSLCTLAIQNAAQSRRETKKLVLENAFKDYEMRYKSQNEEHFGVYPFPVMVAYHETMVRLVEQGKFTPENAAKIFDAMQEMSDALLKEQKKVSGKRSQ